MKYHDQVVARDPNARDYMRMFMMPGVLHCAGGPGPDAVDWASVIDTWVDKGQAPDRVIARKVAAGGAVVAVASALRLPAARDLHGIRQHR